MRRYNIRMDGEVMPNSYSYEELLLNDIFDFDDIEVKEVSKSNWTNIKSFYFPEEHESDTSRSTSDFDVDDKEQAHFHNQGTKKGVQPEFVINEFGEAVSRNNIGGGSSSNSSSSSSSSSSSNTSSSDDNTGWKVFFTIVAIIIFIVITCTTGWGSIPAGAVEYVILRSIWSDSS